VTPNDPAGLSQLPADLDGFSDQAFRSLDILARTLHVKDAKLEPALRAIVFTALDTLGSAWHAGLILVSRGELVPQVTTGPPPQLLDELQQKLKAGPCLTAAAQQALVRVEDMRTESRWPGFAADAERLGVRSMLCVPLRAHERSLGALSLYADHTGAFSSHDEQVTRLYATLAAIALAEAQRTDQLHTALATRDVIGQAKGILMERHRVSDAAAFDILSRASQNANMRLPAVARHLAETGELIGTPPTPRLPRACQFTWPDGPGTRTWSGRPPWPAAARRRHGDSARPGGGPASATGCARRRRAAHRRPPRGAPGRAAAAGAR
jgi:GAF domain-containing protein